ncbi:MAG: hypothetical protein Q9M43_03585 [Sulfurimonas sp.]|nr:hypothetical protein [Sulfurimonas sp.]
MEHGFNSSKDNQDQQTKEKQRVDYSYENTSLFSIQTPIRFSKEHNERTYVEFMLDKSSKVDKLAKLTNNHSLV